MSAQKANTAGIIVLVVTDYCRDNKLPLGTTHRGDLWQAASNRRPYECSFPEQGVSISFTPSSYPEIRVMRDGRLDEKASTALQQQLESKLKTF